MKEIPYSVLKQNARIYEIMLLHDQSGKTFIDIAKQYEISSPRVRDLYLKGKIKQIRLYMNHIALMLGHEDSSKIRKVVNDAFECYQDWIYTCGYLEKKYKDILDEYRGEEPGMTLEFIRTIPPFKVKLSEKIISQIIQMREIEKMSYISIGNKLQITCGKAQYEYDLFYHKKVLELINALTEKAESDEEKSEIWMKYFEKYKTPKKRYDALCKSPE